MFKIDDRVKPVRSTWRGTIVETVDRWHLVSLDGPSRRADRNFMGKGLEWFHEEDLCAVCKPREINQALSVLASYKLV